MGLLVVLLGSVEAVQALRLRSLLTDAAGTRVRAQAKPVIDGRLGEQTGPGPGAPRPPLRDLAAGLATDLTSADTGAVVLGPGGLVLGRARPGTVGAEPPPSVPTVALERALAGAKEVDVIRSRAGERILVALVPFPGGGPPPAVVALSTSLAEEDRAVRRQLALIAVSLIAAVGVAGVAGPLLIRRALRPLRRIAATTAGIAEGDFSRRVAFTGPPDAIGQLAGAVDEMAASLQRVFADLAASEARMRVFVADAAHELRTPLTALGGFADVLVRGAADADPEGAARLLVGLRREVDRMQRLVDDLLTLARLDTGAGLDCSSVELSGLAQSVLAQMAPLAGRRRLSVSGGPVEVHADADRLRQVLLNLVGNAVRHTAEDGSIAIEVSVDADEAKLGVVDDGEGMDEATRARAFERFVRGAGAGRSPGSGLGLAIVASIAAAHGGSTAVASARGEGTRVSVHLPVTPGVQGSARST